MTVSNSWQRINCPYCRGYGMRSSYTSDGSDFLGAEECNVCDGNAVIWLSPKGRYAKWPGGHFIGSIATQVQHINA